MVCPNCGYRVPSGVGECPRCAEPVLAPKRKGKGREWTATDLAEGILFPLLGVVLLVIFLPLLLQSFGPALDAITGTPAPSNINEATWVANSRWYTVPIILEAFSDLMWSLAGLFLVLAGIFSLAAAKGLNQALAAVVFMVFGLFADAASFFIFFQTSIQPTLGRRLFGSIDTGLWFHVAQLIVLVLVLVLIGLKKNAQKKQKFKKAAEKAQALQAARMQAAVRAAAQVDPQAVQQMAAAQAPAVPTAAPPTPPAPPAQATSTAPAPGQPPAPPPAGPGGVS